MFSHSPAWRRFRFFPLRQSSLSPHALRGLFCTATLVPCASIFVLYVLFPLWFPASRAGEAFYSAIIIICPAFVKNFFQKNEKYSVLKAEPENSQNTRTAPEDLWALSAENSSLPVFQKSRSHPDTPAPKNTGDNFSHAVPYRNGMLFFRMFFPKQTIFSADWLQLTQNYSLHRNPTNSSASFLISKSVVLMHRS